MKQKKWLCLLLTTVMALAAFGGLAGCKEKEPQPNPPHTEHVDADNDNKCDVCGEPMEQPAEVWTDSRDYYLVGDGKGTLKDSGWDQTKDLESLKFTKDTSIKDENVYTIEAELYGGDQFQIIHDFAWSGQKGFGIVERAGDEGKDQNGNTVLLETAGGGATPNILVAEGADGKYELTLKTHAMVSDDTLTVKLLEKIETVTVTYYGADGSEIGSESVKKGTAVTPETPESDKLFFSFDGWYTAQEGGEKYSGAAVTGDLKLYARFAEEENAGYVADENVYYLVGAAKDGDSESSLNGLPSWTITDHTLSLKKDTSYQAHNVFTIELTLFGGDEFKISYGDSWDNAIGQGAVQDKGTTFGGSDNIALLEGNDGIYELSLVTNGTEALVYWKLIESLMPASPYYFTGTYHDTNWLDDYENENTIKLTQNDDGLWTGILTITEEMYPDWSAEQSPDRQPAAAIKIKNMTTGSDYGVGEDGSGSAGTVNIWLKAGTYYFTFDEGTGVITYEAYAYYVVGTFLDEEGNAVNFAIKAGVTPALTVNEDGTYSVELEIPDVSGNDAFGWLASEGDGAVFALKVVYGCAGSGAVDVWYGVGENGGDNCFVLQAGTYTVTFNPADGTLTCTAKA